MRRRWSCGATTINVVPLSAGKAYAEKLPNARLEIVKACGHCVDMEQPAALAKLVTTFID